MDNIYDITIIGGGPVGMYGSFYAAMQGLQVKLVDSLEHLGGQLTAIYPEKYIYDLPGHIKIRAGEMVQNIRNQMNQYEDKITISTSSTVTDVVKEDEGRFLIRTTKDSFYSRSILITAGNGAFNPRTLDLECEHVENLHYFVTDMNQFTDKKVVIFGGGDSAVDWALMLTEVAKEVTIVHRREDFRAHAGSVDKLQSSNVKIYTSYKPVQLIGQESHVDRICIEHVTTGEQIQINTDDIIVLFGFVSSLGPIKDWGLEFHKTALSVDSTEQTNIDGIFAAGDAATFDGKIKMITTGFGEAVVAINAAKSYAFPGQTHRHQHSSNIGAKKL